MKSKDVDFFLIVAVIVALQMTFAAILGILLGWWVPIMLCMMGLGCYGVFEARQEQQKPSGKREWVKINSQSNGPQGWIPRDVLEGLGVDCSPLDRCIAPGNDICWEKGQECNEPTHHQGVVWLRDDQSAKLHSHPEFEPTDK